MSEQATQEFEQSPEQEFEALKARANLLGVSFHPSIKIEKLREKIDQHIANADKPKEDEPEVKQVQDTGTETVGQARKRMRDEASKLVRVNIVPMDPTKRDYHGEIFTVGNDVVGTFKRMVPFNTTDGWHVEQIILNMIKDRKCQIFVSKKVNGREVKGTKEGKLIPAFGIEYLDPLSPKEIKDLAQRQAMAAGGED